MLLLPTSPATVLTTIALATINQIDPLRPEAIARFVTYDLLWALETAGLVSGDALGTIDIIRTSRPRTA